MLASAPQADFQRVQPIDAAEPRDLLPPAQAPGAAVVEAEAVLRFARSFVTGSASLSSNLADPTINPTKFGISFVPRYNGHFLVYR